MSVFRGSITEYPGVIVDHFIPFNCDRGRAFFLSHCHKDHMTGLGSTAIINALQRRSASLYCSEVTCSLLLKDPEFVQLAPYLKGLPMDQPISMSLDPYSDCSALTFTVTLLPAGHCPGSAMFFFQGGNGNVLYTGDFRLTLEETKRLHSLHSSGRLLDISVLYLDTTFCHPVATRIPSREVSRDHILSIIDSWLSKSPRNAVHLQCRMFGFEHIFMGVAKKFNTKVHIAAWKVNAYSELPAVVDSLTTDGESTRIHCCRFRRGTKNGRGLPCGALSKNGRPPNVLIIKPSTMWFLGTANTITEPYVYLPQYNAYRVLHSMHASYSEVCSFVSYIKPRRVVPCVVPVGDATLTDVHSRLKALLPHSEVVTKGPVSGERSAAGIVNKPVQSSSLTGKSRKRKREENSTIIKRTDGGDGSGDSDDQSGDTIDEFASSEEKSQKRLFSSVSKTPLLPKRFALPSMLPSHNHNSTSTTSADVVELPKSLASKRPATSVSSSDSGSASSLEQPPLDLSLESSPETKGRSNIVRGTCSGVGKSASLGQCEENESCAVSEALQLVRRGEDSECDDGEEDDEWCLTLDCSSHEEGDDTPTSDRTAHHCAPCGTTPTPDNATPTSGGAPPTKDTDNNTPNVPLNTGPARTQSTRATRHPKSAREPKSTRTTTDKGLGKISEDHQTPTEHSVAATPRKLFHKLEGETDQTTTVDYNKTTTSDDDKTITQVNKTAATHIKKTTTPTDTYVKTTTRVDYIDLTQDDDEEIVRTHNLSPSNDHQAHQTTCTEHRPRMLEPDLIIIDDSAQSGSCDSVPDLDKDSDITFYDEEGSNNSVGCVAAGGSPLFLPPTPGREEVTSILERRSIAFS